MGGGIAIPHARIEGLEGVLGAFLTLAKPIDYDAVDRRPVDVVEGETLSVVGRIREVPPAEVTVRGSIAGEAFEETIPLQTEATEQSTDLRLRWAGERLRQLLLDGAGREEVAELGVRYGLITPFSSYYVPSAAELSGMGPMGSRWIERPNLLQEVDRQRRPPRAGSDAGPQGAPVPACQGARALGRRPRTLSGTRAGL